MISKLNNESIPVCLRVIDDIVMEYCKKWQLALIKYLSILYNAFANMLHFSYHLKSNVWKYQFSFFKREHQILNNFTVIFLELLTKLSQNLN